MRNILLAGVALVGVSAYLSEARAQAPTPPPTVFPETTTPGKLDGAAPGSVTINIGFQQLTAIMAEWGTGSTGENTRAFPQLFNWFHFFPSMDYGSPQGIHYGISAEIRNNNSGQGGLDGGNGGNTFYVHDAHAYVKSDRFGEFVVGTPNGALDDLGVGTGDDFGDGVFYSWYGPPNAPNFAMADSYDGDTPRQKILYESPKFAGMITAGVSYQPTDVPLDHSTSLITGDPFATGSTTTLAHPAGLARNRIEAAVQLNKTFGVVGVKANIGYAGAGVESNALGIPYQTVSYLNGGLVITFAGVELEGSVSSGRFNVGSTSGMSPGSPAPSGSRPSTVYIAGLGYNMGPYGIGVVYYGMTFDDLENGGPVSRTDTVQGAGLGATYTVGPGVQLQLDAYAYNTKSPASTNGSIIALAAQYAF